MMLTASRQRVLLVAPSPPPSGGMAIQAAQLEKLLKSDGTSIEFFPSNFAFPRPLHFLGRVPGLRTLSRFALIWILLWNRIRRTDVVHILAASWLYFFVVVYPAVILGWAMQKRVVLNYRGGEAKAFFRLYGWAVKPAFRMASIVTTPSGFLVEVIRNRFGVPVSIVPNILDTSIFRYRQRASLQPKMLVTRQLEKIYDIESVLKAFRAVQQDYPEASLWIAGTGSQEAPLRSLAEAWNLANVRFLGQVTHTQLPDIYDQCDIYLNASRVDNFPAGLLEASASGLVVISTAPGGIRFMYHHGKEALLVEPGDCEGLAQSVRKVLQDPVSVQAMTKAAAALADACEWRAVRESLYRVYGFPPEALSGGGMQGRMQCAAG